MNNNFLLLVVPVKATMLDVFPMKGHAGHFADAGWGC